MICDPCKTKSHTVGDCTNPATCTCQHRECNHLPDGTIAPKKASDAA